MSYHTEYTLEHDVPEEDWEVLSDALEAIGHDEGLDLVEFGHHGGVWDGHEWDMLRVSNKFPGAVFILTGVGEDYPDMWKKRFHNGEVWEVRAEIVWPDFPPLS